MIHIWLAVDHQALDYCEHLDGGSLSLGVNLGSRYPTQPSSRPSSGSSDRYMRAVVLLPCC